MLFQLEVLVWLASLLIIVIVPIVWLYRLITRSRTVVTREVVTSIAEHNMIDHDEELSEGDIADDTTGDIHNEDMSVQYTELESSDDFELGYDTDSVTEIDGGASSQDEVTIQHTTITEIDYDGDGVTDELILQQQIITLPQDLAEIKRQKSLDMINFDLRALKEKGQIALYEKKLIEARALHSDEYKFTVMLADHYYEQAEYKKGLGLYRTLVAIDPTDDKALAMSANCYIKLGERDNAQIILERLVQDKAENPRYWMSLAEVYYHNKELDKTIECVKMMVKLRPTNSDYLSTLAQLYHESEYYDLYVQILYRMLELDPLNHEIKAEIEKYS